MNRGCRQVALAERESENQGRLLTTIVATVMSVSPAAAKGFTDPSGGPSESQMMGSGTGDLPDGIALCPVQSGCFAETSGVRVPKPCL